MKIPNLSIALIAVGFCVFGFVGCSDNHPNINQQAADTVKKTSEKEPLQSKDNKAKNKDTISEKSDLFRQLDKNLILTRLFDNPKLDSSGTAMWIPNYSENMQISASYDGKIHTNIDTIMYFKDHKGFDCAVVIFTHYNYVKEYLDSGKIGIGGSHFTGVPLGIALFTRQDGDNWKIYCFEKHFSELGYFGTYRTGRQDQGKIGLKKTGDNWTCLSLRQGIGGSTGVFWGYESLYSIEQFGFGNQQKDDDEGSDWYDKSLLQNLLSYDYYFSSIPPNDKGGIEMSAELKIIEKKNDYSDIQLVKTKNGKKFIETYFYDELKCRYIKK